MARILVVDDDEAVQTITRLLLEREGHTVYCASDGCRALQVFQNDAFDLLIIDIFMPDMDGLETMKMVHQYRPSTPIIVISGNPVPSRARAPDFLAMSTKLGAVCSLQKPFKSGTLLNHVAYCLETDRMREQHQHRDPLRKS